MKARFESRCPECEGRIRVGDQIRYQKGAVGPNRFRHDACQLQSLPRLPEYVLGVGMVDRVTGEILS